MCATQWLFRSARIRIDNTHARTTTTTMTPLSRASRGATNAFVAMLTQTDKATDMAAYHPRGRCAAPSIYIKHIMGMLFGMHTHIHTNIVSLFAVYCAEQEGYLFHSRSCFVCLGFSVYVYASCVLSVCVCVCIDFAQALCNIDCPLPLIEHIILDETNDGYLGEVGFLSLL